MSFVDICSMLSLFLLLLVNLAAGYLLPNPPGRYNVTLKTGTLIDHTRPGPSALPATPRALMLSVFRPATCTSTVLVPYMPNKTAEHQGVYLQKHFNISADLTPLFLDARLPVCLDDASSCSDMTDHPILLFSPAYGIPRLYYNVMASAIASEGFIVITIDHPEDANVITYPDGYAVYYNGPSIPTTDEFTEYVRHRVADVSFVIDQLSNATAMVDLLPQHGPQTLPTDRIAILGHSLGAATAVIATGHDSRLRAAINWDGTLFGSLPPSGLSKPVLYMSEANATDPSWLAAWPQLKGPKLWLTVANTTHQSFLDAPTLLQAAGQDTTVFADLLGAIAPSKLVQILAAYTTVWMNGAFEGKVGGPSLRGNETDRFPEVSIVTQSNF